MCFFCRTWSSKYGNRMRNSDGKQHSTVSISGDTFASRQPDPVLQQLEQSNSLATTTNDAFKPVCKYWDRITRPEQLMTALISAMRVLTDPTDTGACCIALPQDVEGESYDYPNYFFKKRVHRITRPVAVEEELEDLVEIISHGKETTCYCRWRCKIF